MKATKCDLLNQVNVLIEKLVSMDHFNIILNRLSCGTYKHIMTGVRSPPHRAEMAGISKGFAAKFPPSESAPSNGELNPEGEILHIAMLRDQ